MFDIGGIGRISMGVSEAIMGKREVQHEPIWCIVHISLVFFGYWNQAAGSCGSDRSHTVIGRNMYRSFDESWE